MLCLILFDAFLDSNFKITPFCRNYMYLYYIGVRYSVKVTASHRLVAVGAKEVRVHRILVYSIRKA